MSRAKELPRPKIFDGKAPSKITKAEMVEMILKLEDKRDKLRQHCANQCKEEQELRREITTLEHRNEQKDQSINEIIEVAQTLIKSRERREYMENSLVGVIKYIETELLDVLG